MLKAKFGNQFVLSYLDKIYRENEYVCPVCNEKVIFVPKNWDSKILNDKEMYFNSCHNSWKDNAFLITTLGDKKWWN